LRNFRLHASEGLIDFVTKSYHELRQVRIGCIGVAVPSAFSPFLNLRLTIFVESHHFVWMFVVLYQGRKRMRFWFRAHARTLLCGIQ
jgi:hypothetical protein